MPPQSRGRGGESRQGLVITIVVLVVLVLILGGTTYLGFADQDTKAKEKAAAEDKLKKEEKALAYYQFQARYYRAAMGHTNGIDMGELANSKEQFDKGQLGTGEKDYDAVKAVFADHLDKGELAWDPAKKQPRATYEGLRTKARNDYDALEKEKQGYADAQREADQKRKEAEAKYEKAQKDFDAALVKAREDARRDLEKEKTDLRALQDKVTEQGNRLEEVEKKKDDEVRRVQVELKKKEGQLALARKALEQRNQELAQYKQSRNEAPATARTDWKIVRMDARGSMPYINLGSADRVRPQLTFSVHGVGPGGRILPKSKGTIEVVNVMGDHLSQARVTSVADPNRDPLLEGDVLYNPLWNPALKRHVAVAGLVDLVGAVRDPEGGLEDFLRMLEREDMVVDAWVDLKDYSVKGPGITVQTDYLVVGDNPEAADRDVQGAQRLEAATQKLKEQARENGVQVISLRKFLELIGHRVPAHLAESSAVSPLYKPRPDQPQQRRPAGGDGGPDR
jgi:hypothetical protein